MSFNEISDFRTALSQLTKSNPGLVKGGWRSVMWVIVSYPDGCFIGYQEIADQAGYAPDTVKTYLRELTKLGFILREQKWVRKGIRQCYRINVKAITEFNSVARDTPIQSNNTSLGVLQLVESGTGSLNGLHLSPTYRYIDKDKYDRTNSDRFSKLVSLLPIEFHTLQQGKNINESLDRLDAKGIPLEVTARHLSDHNYAGASNPISVLIKLLEAFSYAQPDLIAERNRTLEHNRRLDEQNAEIERAKVSPEVASKWLSDIRKGLNQSKNPG
jgi:hypothetical protein